MISNLTSKFLNSKGQSLIEIIFVILIISAFLVASVSLSVTSSRRLNFSKNRDEAKSILEADLEGARIDRDALSFASFVSSCSHQTTVGSLSQFTVDRLCTSPDANTVSINTKVSWVDPTGSHSVSGDTILTNRELW